MLIFQPFLYLNKLALPIKQIWVPIFPDDYKPFSVLYFCFEEFYFNLPSRDAFLFSTPLGHLPFSQFLKRNPKQQQQKTPKPTHTSPPLIFPIFSNLCSNFPGGKI